MKRSGRRGGAKWPKSSAPPAARAAKTAPAGQRAPGSGTPTDLPSRNALCPCGNGKRYKHCHGGPKSPDPFLGVPEDIVGILTDKQTGETRVYRDDVVVRKIRDQHPRLRAAFDTKFEQDVRAISREIAVATSLVAVGVENSAKAEDSEVLRRLGAVMINATDSVVSALELVRQGYGLQAGIVLRSVVEAAAVVLDIVVNEESIQKYRARQYSPKSAATRAKKVFGIVGPLYGALSNHHTHVGEAHEAEYPIDSTGPAALASLRMVKAATALVGLTVELLFQRSVAEPRYWKPRPGGALTFAPDAGELTLLRDFPRLSTDEATEDGVMLTWTGVARAKPSGI